MSNEIVYAIGIKRVSSIKQGLQGDSPEQQKEQIERRVSQFSQTEGIKVVIAEWFEFTESASGELDVQPILKTLEFCRSSKKKIKYAFFKSIDRSTRGGATTYGLIKSQFISSGVQLVDVYGVIGTKTVNTLEHLNVKYPWSEFSPTWITELLEAERARGEVRDILSRMIGAEIRYVRMGYRVRPSPPGFINEKIETPVGKRVILKPHPEESKWFIRMFELRIQGNLSDEEIVKEVNNLGYRSRKQYKRDPNNKTRVIGTKGGNPLTVKQFQRFIQNPIYAGVNTEKWTNGQPIKEKFGGLVTIDIFNRANRGKVTIIEDGDQVMIYKGQIPKWRLLKNKDNPLYPYKQFVLCPICRNPLFGSASTGKGGVPRPAYHCGRKINGERHNFRVKLSQFNDLIKEFSENIEFSDEFIQRFQEIILEEWEKREKQLSGDTINYGQRVIEKETEISLLKEKIKLLNSATVIQSFEEDIERLQLEKTQLMALRDKKEDDQVEVQTVINYYKYYMEHLEELLLGSDNPHQNAAMFSLVFEETPTYQELIDGTPKLACIFKLNEAYKKSKSLSVTRLGFEPRTKSLKGFCSTVELSGQPVYFTF